MRRSLVEVLNLWRSAARKPPLPASIIAAVLCISCLAWVGWKWRYGEGRTLRFAKMYLSVQWQGMTGDRFDATRSCFYRYIHTMGDRDTAIDMVDVRKVNGWVTVKFSGSTGRILDEDLENATRAALVGLRIWHRCAGGKDETIRGMKLLNEIGSVIATAKVAGELVRSAPDSQPNSSRTVQALIW